MIGRRATQLVVLGLCMAAGCGDAGGGSALGGGGVAGNTQTSGELEVLETVPARSETEAETDAELSVLFSEPLLERSVTSGSVTLDSVGDSISGAVSLVGEDMLVFTPEKRLALMRDYTAALHGHRGALRGAARVGLQLAVHHARWPMGLRRSAERIARSARERRYCNRTRRGSGGRLDSRRGDG
jgi:hypothetical protein